MQPYDTFVDRNQISFLIDVNKLNVLREEISSVSTNLLLPNIFSYPRQLWLLL